MSFCEEIRRAVTAAPRIKLPEIRSALYKAFAAGQLSEAEAEELDSLINAKAALPAEAAPRRRVGSRPRSSASMERRRSWAAAGRLPPALASRFTVAEQAALAVAAEQVKQHGACTLTIGHIAALAGICPTSVKNALRTAQALGLLRIEERRLTAFRNLPNRVTITAPEWLSWLRIGPKGGGGKFVPPTNTRVKNRPRADAREHHPGSLFRHRPDPDDPEKGIRQSRGG